MHLGIKNLGIEPLPLRDAANQWDAMVLLARIGLDIDRPGTRWLIGEKKTLRERLSDFWYFLLDLMPLRDRSLEDHNEFSETPVKVQINNKGSKTVIVALGNEEVALAPGVIEVYEAKYWIEITETMDTTYTGMENT